jgi:hypothetical protein
MGLRTKLGAWGAGLAAAGGLATPARANRCAWDDLQHASVCCTETQEALWSPFTKEVFCVPSVSGDSCVWNDLANATSCCATNEHGVWNPLIHDVDCFPPKP